MRGLYGKRVLITGGGRGIGLATAERFVAEGCRVAVIDSDRDACHRIETALPGMVLAAVADVSDRAGLEPVFDTVLACLGGLDVLINNAGISVPHRFLAIEPDDWRRVTVVNLDGVFHVAQLAARHMAPVGGIILNMGSVSGLVGIPGYAAYNASKAAVIELTRTMALELAPRVRVAAVCPGYVLTDMQRAEYTEEAMAALNRNIPLGRHAEPAEIAALFAFLASEEAPFITGSAVIIDGGESAGGLASRHGGT